MQHLMHVFYYDMDYLNILSLLLQNILLLLLVLLKILHINCNFQIKITLN